MAVGASRTADICKRHLVPPNVAGQIVPKAATCDDRNNKQRAETALNECILVELFKQMIECSADVEKVLLLLVQNFVL